MLGAAKSSWQTNRTSLSTKPPTDTRSRYSWRWCRKERLKVTILDGTRVEVHLHFCCARKYIVRFYLYREQNEGICEMRFEFVISKAFSHTSIVIRNTFIMDFLSRRFGFHLCGIPRGPSVRSIIPHDKTKTSFVLQVSH